MQNYSISSANFFDCLVDHIQTTNWYEYSARHSQSVLHSDLNRAVELLTQKREKQTDSMYVNKMRNWCTVDVKYGVIAFEQQTSVGSRWSFPIDLVWTNNKHRYSCCHIVFNYHQHRIGCRNCIFAETHCQNLVSACSLFHSLSLALCLSILHFTCG